MLSEDDIARIARRLADGLAPLVVGSFGSYAVGAQREKSDLDLFIVARPGETVRVVKRRAQELLFSVLHPLDVHVFAPTEFESTAHERLAFTWNIAQTARLYHWMPDAARLVPSLLSRVNAHSAKAE